MEITIEYKDSKVFHRKYIKHHFLIFSLISEYNSINIGIFQYYTPSFRFFSYPQFRFLFYALRVFKEGLLRIQRGVPLLTLNQSSTNPQLIPSLDKTGGGQMIGLFKQN
jgi:hypothetical protein